MQRTFSAVYAWLNEGVPPYPDIFQIKDIELDRYLKKVPYNSSILLKIYHLSLFFLYEIAWYE